MMKLEKSWHEALKEEIKKPYIKELKRFLEEEKSSGFTVYPDEALVFNAFLKTPYDKVKVVIIGQDPYHGPGQAHGLSFSVPKGVPLPPSLKNIFKELQKELNIPMPSHGCLESWASQGVLLLNATLTVRASAPKSHHGKGWEMFTDAVVEALCKKKDPVVFLLWGQSAQCKAKNVLEKQANPHVVFCAAHPSPYSVSGFLGCNHFIKANECLKKWGKTPINWEIENL